MDKLNFKYKRDLGTDIFTYLMSMKGETDYSMVKINEHRSTIKEDRTNNKTVGLTLKVPKKKIVYDNEYDVYVDYEKAILLYTEDYLEEYTKEIDDTDKFDETHNKAYNMLYNKFMEII